MRRRNSERRAGLGGGFGVDLLDKALEHVAGAEFGELRRAVGEHVPHDLGPADATSVVILKIYFL